MALSQPARTVGDMTGQGDRWTAEDVLALAPDAASRKAGSKLAGPGPWSGAGAGDEAVWGLCKGSGKTPYRTVVDLGGTAYRCSCPSRKFPCKHALGLLLLWGANEDAVPDGQEPPSWATEWLTSRRSRAERAASPGGAATGAGAKAADPEAARRRADRRAQRVAAGATELEQRLTDLLRGGLAGVDRAGYTAWDETAARMVDAQAPGLAARVRELGAVPNSGPGWPARLLAQCSLLHLLDQGYLGVDELPEDLAATVRSRVGITTDSAEVLADPERLLRDRWLVLAQHDTTEGRLAVRRVWLTGEQSGRPALVLSYGAAGRAPELLLPVGSVFEAELAFYPGVRPLRAALGQRHSAPEPGHVPAGTAVEPALTGYGAALRDDPWLESWPAVLAEVVVVPGAEPGEDWQLVDAEGDAALPLHHATPARSLWQLAAISGGRPLTVFGECGHQGFAPHTVWGEADVPISL